MDGTGGEGFKRNLDVYLMEKIARAEAKIEAHLVEAREKFEENEEGHRAIQAQLERVENWLLMYSRERKFLIWAVGAGCGAIGMKLIDLLFYIKN